MSAENQSKLDVSVPEESEGDDEKQDEIDENQRSLEDIPGVSAPDEEGKEEQEGEYTEDKNNRPNASEETLERYGVEDDPMANNPKLANPNGELEEDRRTNKREEPETGEQAELFVQTQHDDQRTLRNKKAQNQFKFNRDNN
jgi:hypothetical protein